MQTFTQKLNRQNDIDQDIFPNTQSSMLTSSSINGKKVAIDFKGGNITSDAGVLVLSEIEHQAGIIHSLSECISDSRRCYSVNHSVEDMLSQRVFQIACGYEDANDSDTLRGDPAVKMAVGRLPVEGDDLASQPTISRLENQITDAEMARMRDALLSHFIHSYDQAPVLIVLDFDDTSDTVHGHQQMAMFNSYYDEYCFMPLHVYEGLSGKLITAVLRPGKRSSGEETVGHLAWMVKRIREHWQDTIIVFRGDGHFSSPELFDYIDQQDQVFFVTGLTSNKKLLAQVKTTITAAQSLYQKKQRKVKLYHSFYYQAGSWSTPQRVVAKVEMSAKGLNVRFVVTNMVQAKAGVLYETIYSGRGNMELMIKDHKTYTKSDRTSCHSFTANQFRLLLHSAAYILLHTLRAEVLRGTELANATFDTLCLKLLKIGARIVELKTKVNVHLPSAYPLKRLLKKCLNILAYLRKNRYPAVSPVQLC